MGEVAKVWDQAAIVALLASNERAVVRAIKALYARQTADEKASSDTKHQNGRGFNSTDARFLSSVAEALPRWNDRLTPRQLGTARKMLPKYWRQLLEEIEAKGGQVAKARTRETAIRAPSGMAIEDGAFA